MQPAQSPGFQVTGTPVETGGGHELLSRCKDGRIHRKKGDGEGILEKLKAEMDGVLGSWVLVPRSWFLVPRSWFLVSGSWFLVLGFWFEVPGSLFLDQWVLSDRRR